jgi:hypothetical protein
MKRCDWHCGRLTENSSICSPCWQSAELSRTISDEGYEAWIQRKRAEVKVINPTRQAAATKAAQARRVRMAAFEIDSPTTSTSQAVEG